MADKKAAVNFQFGGVWYGPDHGEGTVPAEVAKEVGAHVFGDSSEVAEADPVAEVKNAPPSEERDVQLSELANSGGAPSGVVGSAPPHAGPGSGVEAWRRYAEDNEVEVKDDASRADVIKAVEKAGLPV